jgi:hypothetical protein
LKFSSFSVTKTVSQMENGYLKYLSTMKLVSFKMFLI